LIGLRASENASCVDRAVVEAYYTHEALLPLGLIAIATVIGFFAFVAALREVLARREEAAFWTNAGFPFSLVAAALLLARTALQMALVRSVAAGSDVSFRQVEWKRSFRNERG
jgi:hypothetical protein